MKKYAIRVFMFLIISPLITVAQPPQEETILITDFNSGQNPMQGGVLLERWNYGDHLEMVDGFSNEAEGNYAAYFSICSKSGSDKKLRSE